MQAGAISKPTFLPQTDDRSTFNHLEAMLNHYPKSFKVTSCALLVISGVMLNAFPRDNPTMASLSQIGYLAAGLVALSSSITLLTFQAFGTSLKQDPFPKTSTCHSKNPPQVQAHNAATLSIKENPLSKRLRALNNNDCFETLAGIYITTNEYGIKSTKLALEKYPLIADGCHIGFSGWHNFDIMVVRKSAYGIICDYNPDNKKFFEKTVELIRRCPDRKTFAQNMTQFILQQDNEVNNAIKKHFSQGTHHLLKPSAKSSINFSCSVNEEFIKSYEEYEGETSGMSLNQVGHFVEIAHELKRTESWLSNDASYLHIKSIVMKDRLVALTADIKDTERFKKIAKLCRDNNMEIDSLYLSNICSYLHSPVEQKAYASTVHELIRPDTILLIVLYNLLGMVRCK